MKNLFTAIFATIFLSCAGTLYAQNFAQNGQANEEYFYLNNANPYGAKAPYQQLKVGESYPEQNPKSANYNDPQPSYETPAQPKSNASNASASKGANKIPEKYSQYGGKRKPLPFIDSESKTKGNYFGIDFINTTMRYREDLLCTQQSMSLGYCFRSSDFSQKSKNGFSIKYQRAFNYKGAFFAPEIFYNHINNRMNYDFNYNPDGDMSIPNNYGYRWAKVERQYGLKFNIGYDINSDFAPYAFIGISRIKYSNLYPIYMNIERNDVIQDAGVDPFQIHSAWATAPIYGFGAKIKFSSNFYLNAEYMASEFLAKTKAKKYTQYDYIDPNYPQISNENRVDGINLKTFLRIVKIGVSYNF